MLVRQIVKNVKDEKTTRLSASGYFRFDARRTYRGCKKWCSDPSTTLKQDPYALETAYVSVITFDSTARQTVPLTDLLNFNLPSFSASGTTALGEALSLTANRIDAEVQKTTAETKGDWRPLVFLMTDGGPTDDWRKGLNEFKAAKKGVVVACAAGHDADTGVLKEITEIVLQLDTADSSSIKAFSNGCQPVFP